MSRSHRKSFIAGHTKKRSERDDKKRWHQRWRSRERTALSGASPDALEAHMTVERNQISNPWWMSKDGRSGWSLDRRIDLAKRIAAERGRTHQERAALEARLLRKWMGK